MGEELKKTEITGAKYLIIFATISLVLFFSYIITGTKYLVVLGKIFLALYLGVLAIIIAEKIKELKNKWEKEKKVDYNV